MSETNHSRAEEGSQQLSDESEMIDYQLDFEKMTQEVWTKTYGKKPRPDGAGVMVRMHESGSLPYFFPLKQLEDANHYWSINPSALSWASSKRCSIEAECAPSSLLNYSQGTSGDIRTPVWLKLVEGSEGTNFAPSIAQAHPYLSDVYMIPSPWQARTIFGLPSVLQPAKASEKFPVSRYVFRDSDDDPFATVITSLDLNELLKDQAVHRPSKLLTTSRDLWTRSERGI